MIDISVTFDVKKVTRQLNRIERKQIPFATMQALNDTAFQAHKKVKDFIPKVFDNPTPWVRKGVEYTKATKIKLRANVRMRDFGGKGITGETMLSPHIYGGGRKKKRSELRMGAYLMPGKSAKRNKFGNIPASQISKALSDMGQGMVGIKTGAKKAKYFFKTIKGTTAIWERYGRKGSQIRPFLVATKAPRYRKRFPFFKIVKAEVAKRFPINFDKRMRQALATAR